MCAGTCSLRFFEAFWVKRKREAAAAVIAARRARVERSSAAKAAGGLTMDGYNYFFTVAELDEWVRGQVGKLERLLQTLLVSACQWCDEPFVWASLCAPLMSFFTRKPSFTSVCLGGVGLCVCVPQPLTLQKMQRAFTHWRKLINLYKNLKNEKPDHLRNARWDTLACCAFSLFGQG